MEAHLYFTLTADAAHPALLRRYEALLTPEDRARRDRFRLERSKLEHVVTRALARDCLSRHADVPPDAWRFEADANGRPEIVGPERGRRLRFNLTHTEGLVACLVATEGEVGVDAEWIDRPGGDLGTLAEQVFSTAEIAALRALPEGRRGRRFFEYWTLKEAFLKARGTGLSTPLALFSMVLAPGAPVRIEVQPELGEEPERWHFTQHAPTPGHLLATAIRGQRGAPPQIRVERTVPFA